MRGEGTTVLTVLGSPQRQLQKQGKQGEAGWVGKMVPHAETLSLRCLWTSRSSSVIGFHGVIFDIYRSGKNIQIQELQFFQTTLAIRSIVCSSPVPQLLFSGSNGWVWPKKGSGGTLERISQKSENFSSSLLQRVLSFRGLIPSEAPVPPCRPVVPVATKSPVTVHCIVSPLFTFLQCRWVAVSCH